jgi:hypothetical protein
MTRILTMNVNWLRAIALLMATLCILAGSLTMPIQSVQAGFTPTPAPPTSIPPTSVPPTSTPVPAPTSRPSSGGGGGGGGGVPSAVAEAPPAAAPLPETGQADWWLTLVLFFWGGSLLLLLPMIGPLQRRWKQHVAAKVIDRVRRR